MFKKLLRWLLLAGLIVGGYFGYQWYLAQQPPGLPQGIVSGNGRIEAVQVDVSTKMAGRIKEVLVNEGDMVAQGEVLARMDTSQIDAALAQAKAQQAQAEHAVKQSQANLAREQSDLDYARKEMQRYEDLKRGNTVSQSEYDQQRNVVQKAIASLESGAAAIEAQKFAIEAAVAHVNEIMTQLDDAVLKAPAKGRVLYKLAESGEVVAAGGKILTILDLTDIYMEVFVPADAAVRLRIGGEARVVFDIAPEYAARAKVTFVSPEAQFTPKQIETASEREKLMFRVKVQLPPERVEPYMDRIKTGIRGEAYLKLSDEVVWPERLEQFFPDEPPSEDAGSSLSANSDE